MTRHARLDGLLSSIEGRDTDLLPFRQSIPADTPSVTQGKATRTPPDALSRAINALRAAEQAVQDEDLQPTGRDQTPWAEGYVSQMDAPLHQLQSAISGGQTNASTHASAVARAAPSDTDNNQSTDRKGADPRDKRIISIHLPDFAMARWHRWALRHNDAPPDDLPVVLATQGPHGAVIFASNRAAHLAGAQTGGRVVDLRTLCPDLRVVDADPTGDAAALKALMLWMRRWCPWSAVDGPNGLVLDATGSTHLWGGEAAMLRDIEGTLATFGLSAAVAMAPTHGAAWALARFGPVRAIATPDTCTTLTAALPAACLRLNADTVLLLKRLGLKTVGDLVAVPRISLARRFSRAELPQNPLARLDQLTGRLPEPVNAAQDPPRFAVQSRLPEPVQDPTQQLPALCSALCDSLQAAGHGARAVILTAYRTDGEISTLRVSTARPSRDPAHILRLFDDQLEKLDPGFGFDLLTLEAALAEDLTQVQSRLDGKADDGAALAQLVDRLSARLGSTSVRSPAPRARHIPERSERWHEALLQAPSIPDLRPLRPQRMFDTPEEIRVLYAVPEGPPAQFAWRGQTHKIARFAGPERIAPEWWNDRPSTRLRDYYLIEAQGGKRLWIYRDGVLGDGRDMGRAEMPRWFVHGIFV